jgi:light-regulated signal transduction histidine kinase (bacteriophytochrome)
MARLIDELLVLSRIQRVELSPESFDLSEVAVEIMRGIRRTAPRRKAQFSAAPNIRVRADRKLLSTALQKLLENAWKFTSKTTVAKIEFSQVSNGAERTFLVRDNGAGFNMAYAGKLFKAFQRLHAQTEYPGLGTGLAIARAIILRHRGRAWAESAIGEGASFYFTLPGTDARRPFRGVQKKPSTMAGF